MKQYLLVCLAIVSVCAGTAWAQEPTVSAVIIPSHADPRVAVPLSWGIIIDSTVPYTAASIPLPAGVVINDLIATQGTCTATRDQIVCVPNGTLVWATATVTYQTSAPRSIAVTLLGLDVTRTVALNAAPTPQVTTTVFVPLLDH